MNHNNHSVRIMACIHVLEQGKPIGDMDDECRKDTIVCQKCVNELVKPKYIKTRTLPEGIIQVCKNCVLEKLREYK